MFVDSDLGEKERIEREHELFKKIILERHPELKKCSIKILSQRTMYHTGRAEREITFSFKQKNKKIIIAEMSIHLGTSLPTKTNPSK